MLGFENLSGRELLANNIMAAMVPDLLVSKGEVIAPAPLASRHNTGALINVGGENTWLQRLDPNTVDAAMSGFFNGKLLTDHDLTREQTSPYVLGRITSIAVDPSDPSGNTIYTGTANGGVWKTTNF